MFHCDRYNCTMEERHCVRYREIAASAELGAVWVGDPAGRGLTMDRSRCLGCPQGAEIAASYRPENVGAGFIPAREEESMTENKLCIVPGCTRPATCRELCPNCYDKWKRGDRKTVEIKGEAYSRVAPLRKPRKPASETKPGRTETNPVRAETKPVRTEVSKRERATKGNGELPIPGFEAKLLQILADRAGETLDVFFLKCLRSGISLEMRSL